MSRAKSKKEIEPSEEMLVEIAQAARLELARRYAKDKNILAWGKILFPDKFNLPYCKELHEYFVSIRHHSQTSTEAPRNHAKTAIKCFLIPIFQALEEPDAYRHYLNVQATGVKAMSVNTSIKHEIETNPDIYALYGNLIGKRWTDQQFVIQHPHKAGHPTTEVVFTSIGAGQSIRGINYHNIRPDYIIVDDLYDEEDINNPESTLKKNAWFWGSLYPARAKSRENCVHVQGTAINDEDVLDKLKVRKDWTCRTFQAIKTDGSILWPELNSKESLNADRANMGTIIFDRELQNIRRNDATSIIKKKWIKYYEPSDLKFDGHHFVVATLLCVDPSVGKHEENDNTGIALIVKTGYDDGEGNDYWIENVWNEKLTLDGRVLKLDEIAKTRPKEYPVTDARIESISGFGDFTSEVQRRTNLPVTEIEKVKDKITNREVKSKYFENGKVHINRHIDPVLLDTLVYQLTTNHPKFDDLADAVLLAFDDDSGIWNFVK